MGGDNEAERRKEREKLVDCRREGREQEPVAERGGKCTQDAEEVEGMNDKGRCLVALRRSSASSAEKYFSVLLRPAVLRPQCSLYSCLATPPPSPRGTARLLPTHRSPGACSMFDFEVHLVL